MKTTQAKRHADAVDFFYENASFSYTPGIETETEGRHRCAQALADAETWGRDNDLTFSWERDFDGEMVDGYDRVLWRCDAIRECALVASLGGIDLGDETPYPYGVGLNSAPCYRQRPTYCRVVEAELASEVMGDTL